MSSRLDNGVRYATLHRDSPHGGVSLLLQVRAGSLEEKDNQRGAAAFLQRMAFSGTAQPARMVDRVKRLQPDFNPRYNFIAGQEESVYRLDLPDGKPETLAEGLGILAEWAGGMSFPQAEIDRQKTSVATEMRRADTPEHRIQQAVARARYAGTVVGERPPLGSPESIAGLSRDALKSFYDTWYRPEQMMLVVVGAVAPASVEGVVRAKFGALADRAPAGVFPNLTGLTPAAQPVFLVDHEANAIATNIDIDKTMSAPNLPPDTAASERDVLRLQLAERIFTSRIEAIVARDPHLPLANVGIFFLEEHGFAHAGLHASARDNGQGLPALRLAVAEYRRMVRYGPTEAELAVARSRIAAELDDAVAGAGNRSNAEIAAQIEEAAWTSRAFSTPEQHRELLKPMLPAIGRTEIVASMHAFYDHAGRELVALTGREDLAAKGNAQTILHDAFAAAWAAPLSAPKEGSANRWAYGSLADPDGTKWITESRDEAALGLRVLWSHTNGLRMQARRNPHEPGRVLLSLRFDINSGDAKIGHRPAGVDELIERGLAPGGLGRHSAAEADRIFAGSSVHFTGVHVSDDAITYTARCAPGDLSRALQLLRAYSGDPGWRQEAEAPVKQAWLRSLAAQQHDVAASTDRAMATALAGPYAWRRPATPAEVAALTFADARNWLSRALENATLTVSVSGDVGDDAVRTLAVWFGQYRVRAHFMMASIDDARASAIAPVPLKAGVERVAVQDAPPEAVVHVVWQTGDGFDRKRKEQLDLLAGCLQQRMRAALLKRFGGAASVRVWSVTSDSIRGEGQIHAEAKVRPGQADEALVLMRAEAAGIAAKGVEAEAFERAKASLLTGLRKAELGNEYWMSTVMPYAAWQPFRISWAGGADEGLAGIAIADVNAVAARYLVDGTVFAVCGVGE